MPTKYPKYTTEEVQNLFTAALRKAATSPSIVAYEPQPHQKKFHESTKSGRLFIGGNRSGKTVGGATEAVWYLTGTHPFKKTPPTPVKGRGIGVDFDNGISKIMLPEISKWIPPSMLINGSWEDSYHRSLRTLTLTNRSTIEFMSYDQDVDKFAGTSRHFAWFDEEPPEDIFNENLLRLVDVKGDWWLTMTPLIEMSWTFDRLYEPWKNKTISHVDVFEVSTLENKYIDPAALELILEGISVEEKEARTHGTYISHQGLVFKGSFTTANILSDVINSDEWPLINSKWGHFCMLDHGYTNPTAILYGAYDGEGRIIIYDEYYESKRLVHENAAAHLAKLESLKVKPEYIVGDPSIRNTDPITGTSIHQEYAENGVYISLGNNDVTAGISRVGNRFSQNMLFISSRCEKLLWELNRYRWDKFSSNKIAQRNNKKETPVKKDDHAIDAMRYGVVSRPALQGEVELPMGNFMNAPGVARDFDPELLSEYSEPQVFDDVLGSEW